MSLGSLTFCQAAETELQTIRESAMPVLEMQWGGSTSLTTLTSLGVTYLREERCVLVKTCL